MIHTSAALAYMCEHYCDMPGIALARGDVMWLKVGEGWAEVWRDTLLAYRNAKQNHSTVEGILAAIAELYPDVHGTVAELLVGDLLKDEPIPDDLQEVAETWSSEGLAARVWLYWADHNGCDGREVCEGVEVL